MKPPVPSPPASGIVAGSTRSRLFFHTVDVRLDSADIGAVTMPSGITVSLILKGANEVSYTGSAMPDGIGSDGPHCFLTACVEPHEMTRQSRVGAHIRHVGIVVPPEWISSATRLDSPAAGVVASFARHHLAVRRWQPSRRAIFLAEQILGTTEADPLLRELMLESHTLELLAEAFDQMVDKPNAIRRRLSKRDAARLQFVREILARDDAPTRSMDSIAREAGINITTLQEQFRDAFGTTMSAFIRESRIQRARTALEEGLSVGEAAFLAGYGSAANFSTAFKRRFGVPPKYARGRT